MFKKLSSNLGRIFISSGSASSWQDEPADHVFVYVQTPEQWWKGVPVPRFSSSELHFLCFGRIFIHLVKLCPPELWLVPCLGFRLKMVSHSCLEAESFHPVKGAFHFEGAVGCTVEHAWLSLSRQIVSSLALSQLCPLCWVRECQGLLSFGPGRMKYVSVFMVLYSRLPWMLVSLVDTSSRPACR